LYLKHILAIITTASPPTLSLCFISFVLPDNIGRALLLQSHNTFLIHSVSQCVVTSRYVIFFHIFLNMFIDADHTQYIRPTRCVQKK